VKGIGYSAAEIGGDFSEDRYQGCYATFGADIGEPWALYSAVRIPGTGDPLRWRLEAREAEWGIGFPPPWDRPQPNATVKPDGSLSLP
jgi:hypothetical protein